MERFPPACHVKVRCGSLYGRRRLNHRKQLNVKRAESCGGGEVKVILCMSAFPDVRAPTAGHVFSPVDEVLFRINYTRWSAPVNMLRRDASHPSQSSGAPAHRSDMSGSRLHRRGRGDVTALRCCVSLR